MTTSASCHKIRAHEPEGEEIAYQPRIREIGEFLFTAM